MRMRLPLLVALVALPLLLAPSSAAASAAASLKLRACTTGDSAKERRATFYARMRAVPGTRRMMMRFTLVDRAGTAATQIRAETLDEWRRARPGVRAFGYVQRFRKLRAGGAYVVTVEYRWVGSDGSTIRTARRTSDECRQEGELPNLVLTGVKGHPGKAPGIREYGIEVHNDGSAAARHVRVDLFVDGAAADSAELDLVKPGETVVVRIGGPACREHLRAVVDRADVLPETAEADNTLVTSCVPGSP